MASPRLATPPRGRVTRVAAPPPAAEDRFQAGFKDTILQTHFEVPQRLGDTAAVADDLFAKCRAMSLRITRVNLRTVVDEFVKGLFSAWKRDADKLMNLGVAAWQREREAAPVSDAPVSDTNLEAEEGIDDPPSPGSVTADSLLADLAAACGDVLENAQVESGQVQVEIKLTSPGRAPLTPLGSLPDTPISNFISRVIRTPP